MLEALVAGPRTAHQLGRDQGVRASAARRHAEALVEEGLAKPVFRQEGLGRPKKYYELTDAGRERLPRRYDALAEFMADASKEAHGPAGLARTMDAVAERLARDHARMVPADAPTRERVRAAASVLRKIGFQTELEEREDRMVIIRRDCIFRRLAFAHQPEVCGNLDTGLLERILGVPVQLVACMPWGDDACRHEVQTLRDATPATGRRAGARRARRAA